MYVLFESLSKESHSSYARSARSDAESCCEPVVPSPGTRADSIIVVQRRPKAHPFDISVRQSKTYCLKGLSPSISPLLLALLGRGLAAGDIGIVGGLLIRHGDGGRWVVRASNVGSAAGAISAKMQAIL